MIENIIENIEKIYQRKYGVAVFDVKTKKIKSGVEIRGWVLNENQKDNILNIFKSKIKIVKENIKVLSDIEERNEIGWAVVKIEIADLKLRFISAKIINKKILSRIKCSQAFNGEILRVLFKKEDQLLVQQEDLTLGWINKNDVIVEKTNLYKKWKSDNFALRGKVIKSELSADKVAKEAKKFMGVKYVLGGKSKKGIDCSGLVQVAYKKSLDIILPRHSWDQKSFGKKVKLENMKTGDLVFLIKKSNKHKHVGIVDVNKIVYLIHASLDKKKVVKQNMNEVLKSYGFVEVRRIIL